MSVEEILNVHELPQLTQESLESLNLASSGSFRSAQIDKTISSLESEVDRFDSPDQPTSVFESNIAAFLDDLKGNAIRLQTLSTFLEANKDATSHTEIQARAKKKSDEIMAVFEEAMSETLKAQRPLEENVWSLFSFFTESGCDGDSNSVYITNHHAVSDDYAKALGEPSIRDMPLDPGTKQHPVFGMSVDEKGQATPVTIRSMKDADVVHKMTAAVATSSDITKRADIIFWAKNLHASNSVWFTNISRQHVGSEKPDMTQFATKLKSIYGGAEEFHKSMVAVGNRPVVRKKSRFEDEHVSSHPSFALLGKHYYMQKVDMDSAMSVSPINPVKHAIQKDWICQEDGEPMLECPWLRDQRSVLSASRMVFIGVIDGRLGDEEVLSFNSASSTHADGPPKPYTLKIGDHFLQKVITHHLLMNRGGQTSDGEAQNVGRSLNAKLARLAGINNNNIFEKAWVEWESSRCEDEIVVDGDGNPVMDANGVPEKTGKKVQVHRVHVEYKQGVEDFEVRAVTT